MSDARSESTTTSGVLVPPPLIYAGFLLVGWLLGRVWPFPGFAAAWVEPVASLLIAGALLLVATAMGLFRRARTSVLPMVATSALVFGGPYRFTRNPMYLAMTFLYTGLALLAGLAWALLLLPVLLLIVQTQVIAREERYLESKFGSQYLDYKRRVRRWL